jgi:hypothetical protein
MTTNNIKTGVVPTPKTSCITNISQTMNNVQHNTGTMIKNAAEILNLHFLHIYFPTESPDSTDLNRIERWKRRF